MTIIERIAKILIDLPFDEELDNDVNAYAMALAEAIEADMEIFRIVETLQAADNEATASPYWLIIDPGRFRGTVKHDINNVASCITGLFFSREDAEAHLKARHYAFTDKAGVYCESGHASIKYHSFCKSIMKG